MLDNLRLKISNTLYGENSRSRNLILHRKELVSEEADRLSLFATPNPNYVLGFDESHWGGEIDVSQSYARGMRFAFFKAVDGTLNTNYWSVNRPKAIQGGLVVGDYGWLYKNINVSCVSQARAMWNRVKDVPRQLPFVIDFEWTYYGGKLSNPDYSDLDIFLTEFIRVSGQKPLLYTAAGYTSLFGAVPSYIKNKIAGLFVAHYGAITPMLPLGLDVWDFWQFASTLDQDYYAPSLKLKKELDGIYWKSGEAQLYTLAGSTPIPPSDGGGISGMIEDKYYKVTASSLNIRSSGATLSTNDLGTFNLLVNDIVHVVEVVVSNSVTYHRLNKIWRNGIKHEYPFSSMPLYVNSPTANYWSAERGVDVWMVEVPNPEPSVPDPTPLPSSMNNTVELLDDSGNIMAVYKGILTKQ